MSSPLGPPLLRDISRPIEPGMAVWPGDPIFELDWAARRERGDEVNVALIHLGVHTGTHVDAPHHLMTDGAPIDQVPLETFIGKATLVDARGRPTLDVDFVQRVLDDRPEVRRLLVRTGAWHTSNLFPAAFPTLTPEAAMLLKSAGVRLFGTDAPSVDPADSSDLAAHHTLLAAGICILENLLLDDVPVGDYELIAMPLRIVGADASPVRAVLRTP